MLKITKKFLCILFASVLSLSVIPVSAEAESRLYGDVNSDGVISLRDALSVLYHTAFADKKLSENDEVYADVDKDGIITAKDAYQIMLCATDTGYGFNHENIQTNGTVWIASDSISAGVGSTSCGWGNVFGDYLIDGTTVHNNAVAGETSTSFMTLNNYKEIFDNIKAGDLLFICFGHNDNKGGPYHTDPDLSSDTYGSFKYVLKNNYIDRAYRAGAQPVLLTCFVRASGDLFNPAESQYHYKHIQAMLQLAEEYAEQGVSLPIVDVFDVSLKRYQELGKDEGRKTYNYSADDIHLNETGARFLSQIILNQAIKDNWDFAKYINQDKVTTP